MTHNHGNEYQIRMVREDGLEELSGWMNSTEEVAQAIIEVPRPTRQNLLTSGTKHYLSQLLRKGTEFGISLCAHHVSTMYPAQLPLSASSGVEETSHFGCFSIKTFAISWQAQEIGIRMTHGAQPAKIVDVTGSWIADREGR
jgi:hypothetical protein